MEFIKVFLEILLDMMKFIFVENYYAVLIGVTMGSLTGAILIKILERW